jgi:hypothetical protein
LAWPSAPQEPALRNRGEAHEVHAWKPPALHVALQWVVGWVTLWLVECASNDSHTVAS